jgi:hypothetical protein
MILYKITTIKKSIKHKNRAIKNRGTKSDKKSNWIKCLGKKLKEKNLQKNQKSNKQ